jgi:hypothetical protein
MTYGYCKKIIAKMRADGAVNEHNKTGMMDKLDVFLLAERITKQEYNELVSELNGGE